MRTHHVPRRLKAVVAAGTLIVAGTAFGVVQSVTAGAARAGAAEPGGGHRGDHSKPVYAHSLWGFRVEDRTTGEVLLDQNGDAMFTTGSILKVFSTSTALSQYGSDHTFKTPVYRTGPVRNGAVHGDLVLVASGDFSMGLREQPDGTMVFASAPDVDHTYANTGLPGIEVGANPLAALDDLAEQIARRASRRSTATSSSTTGSSPRSSAGRT